MTTQTIQPQQSVLFIDSVVANYQTLINGVEAGTQVVILNADQDGVQQIADVLNQYSNIDSVHILSHGNQAEVILGNTTLNRGSLATYQPILQSWRNALSKTAEILLYGCHVAKGAIGQQFVRQLSATIQANIAASVDLTGAKSLGGNWELAFHCGRIQYPQIFAQNALDNYAGTLATETIAFADNELSGEPLATYTKGTTGYGNLTIKGTDSGTGIAFGSLVNLSNTDYVQTIYTQTLGRSATNDELDKQLSRLDSNQVDREWLAVEIAQNTEAAIHLVGSFMLQDGWV